MSGAKADLWMPLFIGDYLADTMHLTTLQHGAYILLMMHQWRNGPMADDDEELAAIARCDLATWKKLVAPKVRRFFTVTPEGLSQKRLAAEKKVAAEHTEKRAVAGKAGATSRWGKTRDGAHPQADGNRIPDANGNRMAIAEQSHDFANTPSPSPSPKQKAATNNGLPGPAECEQPPQIALVCRSDPPHRWSALAESWEVDQRMINRPVVRGEYVDVLADLVLEAAGINDAHWRGDFRPIVAWLEAGRDGQSIITAVRQVAARSGYRPPGSLKYFDSAVRDYRAP